MEPLTTEALEMGALEMGPRLEAIVLAAGSGRRFGGAKLNAPWRGGKLLDGALEAAFAAPVWRVTVVTGADPAVDDAARHWAAAHAVAGRLALIHADDHPEGMGASLRAGIAALAEDCAGVFVFLGDMPVIPASVPPRLVAALTSGALAAAPAFNGRRGHPVLFCAALFPALARAQGDEGARTVLAALGRRLALVDVADPGVITDVDTPGDLPGG
jgi:molybdenum cofactor cytidylyltransferase